MSQIPSTDGIIIGFRCHDGQFRSALVEEKRARLGFVRADGSCACLVLSDVRYLLIDGFREGNIVDDAYFWTRSSIPESVAIETTAKFQLSADYFTSLLASAGYSVFVLECSYGATVYAVLQSVQLLEGQPL